MSESPSESIAPKEDLDDYIADPFNQSLFQDLEEFGWQPNALDFFKWFHELVGFIENGKPSAALQNLDAHKLDGPFRLWFVYHLRNKFREPLSDAWPTTSDKNLPPAFHVIDTEYERLEKSYPPDMFAGDESIHAKASSAVARDKMVNDLLVNMMKKAIKEGEEKAKLEAEITSRVRQEERERLQAEFSNMAHEVLKSLRQPRQNPEFTTNRQVIALGFILRRLGVRNIDKQTQADFVEFLTGKNNKEIYDRVRELDETVYNKKGTDAQYVKVWFQKLNWPDLVKEIEDLLSKKAEDL